MRERLTEWEKEREEGRGGREIVVFFSHTLVSSASGPAGASVVLLLILEAIHPFTDFTACLCCITMAAGLTEKVKASSLTIFLPLHVSDIQDMNYGNFSDISDLYLFCCLSQF